MSESEVILDYKGPVDFETAESLINELKKLTAFRIIQKPIRKKVYSVFVECLENIYKYSPPEFSENSLSPKYPYINFSKQENKYIIRTGNAIRKNRIDNLRDRLDDINRKDMDALKATYAEIIDDESTQAVEGAGLGLIIIGLRSKKNFETRFKKINDQYSFFEMNVYISEKV
ncbi:MAG: SiaB family protein kinase [Bacteroidales bacterium]|nr:MAG: SiaB family protein kinase [Bacteroidales bacterium]